MLQQLKPSVTPRIMPERMFVGSQGNRSIASLLTDYSGGLPRILREGERRLGAFVLPTFQRDMVWTLLQKQRLIESIYMGLPIGALVVNSTVYGQECDGWLLDGQQRLTAISGYIASEFPVCGYRWSDLPPIERRHFERIYVNVMESGIVDPDVCRDLYDRLAYGGTPHVVASR